MATVIRKPVEKGLVNVPAVNAQATISTAASNAQADAVIVTSITATLACLATPPAALQQVVLRDGATGAGTIVWTGFLMLSAANTSVSLVATDLAIRMTPGNVATLEFVAAAGATTQESVALTSYFEGDTA